jgi:DNA-directed RNA polymerase specialized sigma24 family protein
MEMMDIPEKVLARARKLDRAALEQLFAAVYPVTVRLARGLSGREDVAEGIVRFLMLKAVKMVPRWRDDTAAERWFLHHAILTARRAAAHQPAVTSDLLAAGGDARYTAFVRAVRQLPQQQREAVLLHFGERFNSRYMSIAMDCSTAAAETHLEAGTAALRGIAGAEFEALVGRMAAVYAGLGPSPQAVPPAVGRWVGRGLRPHRLRIVLRLIVLVMILAAVAVVGWQWHKHAALWRT